MINIMIASDDIYFSIALANSISEDIDFTRVCYIAPNRKSALHYLISENDVDIIILCYKSVDEFLYNISNIYKYKYSCILITNSQIEFPSNLIYSSFNSKDSFDDIIFSINMLANSKREKKDTLRIQNLVTRELLYLGYNFSHVGTKYLLDAITYIYESNNVECDNLSSDVYPFLCKKYNRPPENIRCYIARETKEMYFCCPIERLRTYFHFVDDAQPNVKTVINTILNKIA